MMKRILSVLLIGLVAVVGACSQDATLPVTGTVYGDLLYADGTPAANLVVLVEGAGHSAVSDAKGRFVISDIPAVDESGMGKYYTVRGFGMRDGVSMGFLVGHFKVKGQQSYSIGITVVRETGVIRGTILLEGMGDHSGTFVGIEGTTLETVTRANGSFVLDRIPAGANYEIPCEREGFADMTILYYGTGNEEKPVDVSPGENTEVGNHLMFSL